MADRTLRDLEAGFTVEVDAIGPAAWDEALQSFDDASIYQTWAYGAVISGERNNSHIVLRNDGVIVAMAQARIVRLPLLPVGMAYVRWGPLWRRCGSCDIRYFRQAIRALRNEYVCRQRLTLRLRPRLFDAQPDNFDKILAEEGFGHVPSQARDRTILMDLSPPLEELYDGMKPHWKRELKVAGKNGLEIIEGTGEDLFDAFIGIYREMVSRKRFAEPNDISQFRSIQQRLPEPLKMRTMLCRSSGKLCAGLIASSIGATAVYLFGATSNAGKKSRGSYALQWALINYLKRQGVTSYDLNGINPEKNPGTFKFKDDLAGEHGLDVNFLGRFDTFQEGIGASCVKGLDVLHRAYRSLKADLHADLAEKFRRIRYSNSA